MYVLNTNIEFRKGVLFIRFDGVLDKYTISDLDDIYKMIDDNKITNVVFNLNDLKSIDRKGMMKLNEIYNKINKNNYNCYFIENKLINKFKKNMKIDNELLAMETIWN